MQGVNWRRLVHVTDPQEQRQEVLIKRVTNSVDRLSQELADLVVQMDVVEMELSEK